MEKWRTSFNRFLEGYTKDTAKTAEQTFLKNILKCHDLDEITADKVYSTFMQGDGQGDIDFFFARRIADTNNIEDIEKHADLIKRFSAIYGHNSAKIGELLTYGIANARHNLDKFHSSAQENLNRQNYGSAQALPVQRPNTRERGPRKANQSGRSRF